MAKKTKVEFECGVTELLAAITEAFTDRCMVTRTGRLGTVSLLNGRKGQIHLTVTTEREDFLMPTRLSKTAA